MRQSSVDTTPGNREKGRKKKKNDSAPTRITGNALVVEDEEEIRNLLRTQLEHLGINLDVKVFRVTFGLRVASHVAFRFRRYRVYKTIELVIVIRLGNFYPEHAFYVFEFTELHCQ